MVTEKPPNTKRRRFQFGIRTMLIAFLVVALMLGLARDYGWKLAWRLGWDPAFINSEPERTSEIRSIPVIDMPEVSPQLLSGDWTDYRIASLRISVPRGTEVDVSQLWYVGLQSSGRVVSVVLPEDNTDNFKDIRDVLSKFPSGRDLSQAELQAAAYQAGWDDFRWSMGHEEFLWHRWLLSTGQQFCSFPHVDRVETLFREDLEGLLTVPTESAVFNWSSPDGTTDGLLIFLQVPGPLDLDWVRRVCRSLEFSGQSYPKGMSKAELLELIGPIDED